MTTPTTANGRDLFRLDGQIALVTGASRGIGASVARALASAGADVLLSGRAKEELDDVAGSISEEHGVRAATLVSDLTQAAEVEALATRASDVFGRVDVLVNNAGISIPELVTETKADSWDAVMAVNLRAPALLASRLGARMAEAGSGRIVNIASTAGLRALSEHYSYCASKAALIMATKVLALELGPYGVRANVVCPTIVLTEMGQRVWGEEAKAAPMLARIPAGKFAMPQDVASAVVYLASPAAEMLNGTELTVDGGFTTN